MGAARIWFGPAQTAENDKGVRMKRYRGFGSWVTGLVATILAVVLPVQAANDFSSNDEGPFIGGVFSRPIGNAVPLPQTDVDDDEAAFPVLFDENGRSNELIVMLDYSHRSLVTAILPGLAEGVRPDVIEAAIIDNVRGRDSLAYTAFHGAEHARLLTAGMRLDPDLRSKLAPEHPRERLERYIALRYPTVELATKALAALKAAAGVVWVGQDARMEFSAVPNDTYFSINSTSAGRYQWGMHAMNYPSAWDVTKGFGYVGAVDSGLLNEVPPTDLVANYRKQFFSAVSNPPLYPPYVLEFHGTHVLGIIGATANNGIGVTGGCPGCSVSTVRFGGSISYAASGITRLTETGVQVGNLSSNNANESCASQAPLCDAFAFAESRDTLFVVSAGNFQLMIPCFPASVASVLAVAGVENIQPSLPSSWYFWYTAPGVGSCYAGTSGVVAPARSIVSTVPASAVYNGNVPWNCSDNLPADESGVSGDGYASCTGTSMAAPHVSALAGILRSINPRLSKDSIKTIIRQTASHAASPTEQLGSGMPNARAAVDRALYLTPTSRLTPLFSFYSSSRLDYFYTTVPQMGTAALYGSLEPRRPQAADGSHYVQSARYYPMGYNIINLYGAFPGHPPDVAAPRADAWVFTTSLNPKSATIPLAPLYRLSWKCGDLTPTPPAVCAANPEHIDTVYTADTAGVSAYQSVGYQLDGIEGYLYPKTIPQPIGTQRLMRKYNPARDDHAIFPENRLATMTAQGYTQNSGSDWLGYVYPNLTGNAPTIQ